MITEKQLAAMDREELTNHVSDLVYLVTNAAHRAMLTRKKKVRCWEAVSRAFGIGEQAAKALRLRLDTNPDELPV